MSIMNVDLFILKITSFKENGNELIHDGPSPGKVFQAMKKVYWVQLY